MKIQPRSIRIEPSMTRAGTEALTFGEVAFYSAPSPDHPDRNEDAATVIANADWGLLAVSDGAGGTAGGAQAAAKTIEILQQAVVLSLPLQEVRAAVMDAIESANAAIREALPGAMATIAVFILDGRHARAISVGDSVCTVIGGRGKVKYRSIAHGPTGFGEEAGLLKEHEALTHEDRHLVSNMLGLPGMRVEVGVPLSLAPRDTVLVACDGLFDNVRLEEIAERARLRPLHRAVDELAALARKRMLGEGRLSHADDLTMLAFRPGEAAYS